MARSHTQCELLHYNSGRVVECTREAVWTIQTQSKTKIPFTFFYHYRTCFRCGEGLVKLGEAKVIV